MLDIFENRSAEIYDKLENLYKELGETEEVRDNALTPREKNRLEKEISSIKNSINYYENEIKRLNLIKEQPIQEITINYMSFGIIIIGLILGFWLFRYTGILFIILSLLLSLSEFNIHFISNKYFKIGVLLTYIFNLFFNMIFTDFFKNVIFKTEIVNHFEDNGLKGEPILTINSFLWILSITLLLMCSIKLISYANSKKV
jgi:hypothetical protein